MYLENQTEKGTFINDNLYENQYSMMISTIRFRGLFNHNYTLICMPKTNYNLTWYTMAAFANFCPKSI